MRFSIIAVLFLFLISCKDEEIDIAKSNDEEILDYLEANDLDATKSASGLYYIINEPGTGAQPTSSSNVTVAYKGYLTNGNVFDQSDEEGISFPLTGVIEGWTEGITYFKEGGSGVLLIPSALGYGSRSIGSIPANSVLIFDVELLSVN